MTGLTLGDSYREWYMSFLFPAVKTKRPAMDTKKIDPSVRGSIAPLSLGLNRVVPKVAWVGNTIALWSHAHADEPKAWYYRMCAMHLLSIGEGSALTRIIQDGKTIWQGRLTPDNFPSGSQLALPSGEGVIRVYWGGNDPTITKTYNTVDSNLAAYTGVSSRYPYMFYLVWDTKWLGQQKTWPSLEYEIEVNPQRTTLFGKPSVYNVTNIPTLVTYSLSCSVTEYRRRYTTFYDIIHDIIFDFGSFYYYVIEIETTDSDASNIDEGSYMTGTINGVSFSSVVVSVSENSGTFTISIQDKIPDAWIGRTGTLTFKNPLINDNNYYLGINPIALIYQLLFETYPHGLGQSTDRYNLTDMEAIFDYFATAGNIFPASLYLRDGKSFTDGISSVMQDAGILMGWDCVTGKYRFTRPTSTDVATEIPVEFFNHDDAEFETAYDQLDPELRIYSFTDVGRKFTDSTILVTNDGKTKYAEVPNAKKVEMETVRESVTASMVAAYREREAYTRTEIDQKLSKSLLTLLPGGLFSFEDIPGKFRLIEKQIIPDNATIKSLFKEDVYSELSPFVQKEISGLFPSNSLGAEINVQDVLLEANRYINPDTNGIFVLSVRSHPQILGYIPFISNNDSTYTELETQRIFAVGGELSEAIAATGVSIMTDSIKFTVNGPDINTVQDLSSEANKVAWKNGEQMCLIGDEIFFLRGITPVEGEDATYTLDGLIRARLGTVKAAHSIGDEILIFSADSIQLLSSTLLVAGSTIYAKSQPFAYSGAVDLSEIDPISINYAGGGYRPLPPINLSTVDRTRGFVSGTDVSFRWGYRSVVGGAGAGLGLSDKIYNAPLPEGYFRLEFRTTGGTLIRTVDNLTSAVYTYSDTNRISDFSGNSFKVRVYNILNGLVSDYDEIAVTPAGA